MESISNRALSAIERREGPDSLAVQEIIEDWITFFARLAGEKPTPEFVRGFAEEVPAWLENDCNNKLQQLLTRLNPDGEVPPYEKVNRLMLEGLRWKVERESKKLGT